MSLLVRAALSVAGLIAGFMGGGFIGAILGMAWISVFPPDRVAGGPEAGFETVMWGGIGGEAIGAIAGLVLVLYLTRGRPGEVPKV